MPISIDNVRCISLAHTEELVMQWSSECPDPALIHAWYSAADHAWLILFVLFVMLLYYTTFLRVICPIHNSLLNNKSWNKVMIIIIPFISIQRHLSAYIHVCFVILNVFLIHIFQNHKSKSKVHMYIVAPCYFLGCLCIVCT